MNRSKEFDNKALVLCTPKIVLTSSPVSANLLDEELPCFRQAMKGDTLPWTITMDDLTIIAALSSQNSGYICKPLGCKIFLAATSNRKNITSSPSMFFSSDEPRLNPVCQVKSELNIGFVIHADWSGCELFFCKSQVLFSLV